MNPGDLVVNVGDSSFLLYDLNSKGCLTTWSSVQFHPGDTAIVLGRYSYNDEYFRLLTSRGTTGWAYGPSRWLQVIS